MERIDHRLSHGDGGHKNIYITGAFDNQSGVFTRRRGPSLTLGMTSAAHVFKDERPYHPDGVDGYVGLPLPTQKDGWAGTLTIPGSRR